MGTDAYDDEDASWFLDHYEGAAQQIVDFFEDAGISLEGATVADVGSGDGTIDLGLFHKGRPRSLVGFDIQRTDTEALRGRAAAAGVPGGLPEGLEFLECGTRSLPAASASFDFVVSWSTFEHVVDAKATAAEIRRILRPDGALFLQLYPFFHSQHGSHLWTWFPDGFVQLRHSPEELESMVRARGGDVSPAWTVARLADLRSLNRLTIDDLEHALRSAGLLIAKVELLTGALHLPLDVQSYRVTDLAISGIKLLAIAR